MLKKLKERLYILKHWYYLTFSYPKLSLEKVDYDLYWKDKRGKAIGALSDWQKDRADIVVGELKKTPDRNLGQNQTENQTITIADIGGGDGSILDYISKHIPVKKKINIDVSEFALKRAKESGIDIISADITKEGEISKVPEADYFLLFEILEHTGDPERILSSLRNKARRGIFFSFPNSGFFPYRLRLLFGKFPMQWRLHPGEHLRYWTLRDLKWWLHSLGFSNSSGSSDSGRSGYKIFFYKGMPIFNKIWPSLFAAGFVVHLKKSKNVTYHSVPHTMVGLPADGIDKFDFSPPKKE